MTDIINKKLLATGLKYSNAALIQTPKGIKIKYRAPCVLGKIDLKSSIEIGAYTYFDSGRIGSLSSIGNFCSVAPGCTIGNGNHPTDYLTTHPLGFCGAQLFNFDSKTRSYTGGNKRTDDVIKNPPIIGSDVWIAGNVTIFRGVNIGNGAIIGSNSVVNKDIPDFAIVAGTPARVLRYRFSENIIERLQKLSWWDYDIIDIPELSFNQVENAINQLEELVELKIIKKLDDVRPWKYFENI